MKAVVLPGNREVRIDEREVKKPGPGEVLIRTRASAICRSDMGLYIGNSTIVGGDDAGTGRVVPGHEPAGMVAEIGPGVTHVSPGDRIAAHLAIGCGHCEYCTSGYTMLCPQWKCLGFDIDGGDADYFVIPERNCLPLPNEISYVAGALMTDMIGSQYHTQKVLGVRGGMNVAVMGLGPMGAAAVLIAKAFGANAIAVDLLPARLDLAKGWAPTSLSTAANATRSTQFAKRRTAEEPRSPSTARARRRDRTPRSTRHANAAPWPSSASRARPRSIQAIKSFASCSPSSAAGIFRSASGPRSTAS